MKILFLCLHLQCIGFTSTCTYFHSGSFTFKNPTLQWVIIHIICIQSIFELLSLNNNQIIMNKHIYQCFCLCSYAIALTEITVIYNQLQNKTASTTEERSCRKKVMVIQELLTMIEVLEKKSLILYKILPYLYC